jgi:hypothetical protein
MINSTINDFKSRDCKNNTHNLCAAKWYGYGFEVICICSCHLNKKEEALHVLGRPVSNARTSSFKGTLQHDDY